MGQIFMVIKTMLILDAHYPLYCLYTSTILLYKMTLLFHRNFGSLPNDCIILFIVFTYRYKVVLFARVHLIYLKDTMVL